MDPLTPFAAHGDCLLPDRGATLAPPPHWLSGPRDGLKAEGLGGGGNSKGLQGSGIFLPRGPRLPTLREWGRGRGISLGTLGFPPLHRSEGFWGDRGSATHPYTQEVPPHPPRAAECPYCPSPDLQGKWTALSQGGEVRPGWGVGLWRPGPGTQQRKFQAAFRATRPRDMQHTRSSSCGLRHPASQLLASGCLALQPAPTPAH